MYSIMTPTEPPRLTRIKAALRAQAAQRDYLPVSWRRATN
jgi:hypothetical protein